MRFRVAMVVVVVAACGGDESRSPREACIEAEQTINAAAMECDPQGSGTIELSCQNFGTGSGCDAIDDYFACLVQTTCDNGTLVLPTGCQLGICD